MDLLQISYRAGRGVDNAKIFIINTIHTYSECPDTTHTINRLLFSDLIYVFACDGACYP